MTPLDWAWVGGIVLGVGIGIIVHWGAALVLSARRAPERDANRQLVEIDRSQLANLLTILDRITASGQRIEAGAAGVADDLAELHRRAEEVGRAGPPGAAADAAVRQTPGEAR